jgi:hypothetical protein
MIRRTHPTILTNWKFVLYIVETEKNCVVGGCTLGFSSNNGTYRKGNLCANFYIKQYLTAKLKLCYHYNLRRIRV